MDVRAGVRRWQTSRVTQTAIALSDRCAGETLGLDGRGALDRLTLAPPARIGQARCQHRLAARCHGILRITRELAARGAPIAVVGISVVALRSWLPRTVSTFLAGRCRVRVAQVGRSARVDAGVPHTRTGLARAVLAEVSALRSVREELHLALSRRVALVALEAAGITACEIR